MNGPPLILVLGATSAIAQAYARRRASEGASFVLAGRRGERLSVIAADLVARGAARAEPYVADLAEVGTIEQTAEQLIAQFGMPGEIIIAYGVLGEQVKSEQDLAAARANLDTNFTSVALWLLALLKARPADAPLVIVAIGSVAGDRGRASNFVYGAAKAGLAAFLEGLAQKYAGSAVRIIAVKPGFVDTPMTAEIAKGGPLWATPDRVAADIERAVRKRKHVVYTPWFWWPIMATIRHLPWFVFRRLKV